MTRTHHSTPINPPAKAESAHPALRGRDVAEVCAARGLNFSPAQIRVFVKHLQKQHARMTVVDLEKYLLDYADPTGEQAVQNVLEAS